MNLYLQSVIRNADMKTKPTIDECPFPELNEERMIWTHSGTGYHGNAVIDKNAGYAYASEVDCEASRRFYNYSETPVARTLSHAFRFCRRTSKTTLVLQDGDDNILEEYPV